MIHTMKTSLSSNKPFQTVYPKLLPVIEMLFVLFSHSLFSLLKNSSRDLAQYIFLDPDFLELAPML